MALPGNGGLTSLLLWAVAGLAAIVNALIGFIVHLHIKSDDENKRLAARELQIFREYSEKEITRLRDRMHDAEEAVRKREHRGQ